MKSFLNLYILEWVMFTLIPFAFFFHWKSVFDANAQAEKMYITMKINFI